jgi:hypothetical protein
MTSEKSIAATDICALLFGCFLGLCILKFGDPVILDQKIFPPATFSEFWNDSWPTHWANWIFFPLAAIVAIVAISARSTGRARQRTGATARRSKPPANNSPSLGGEGRSEGEEVAASVQALVLSPKRKWIFLFPLFWLGWQFISAARTVDPALTVTTLWQFCGCAVAYFLGALVFNTPRRFNFLLPGLLVAFAICLVCAVRQRIEYPQDTKFLIREQSLGWTNLPPRIVEEMKRDQTIITTNGMAIVNPAILAKFQKKRVMGTMVYPNALAEIILLLFPLYLVVILRGAQKLRPLVRRSAVAVSLALAAAAFFYSGSKFAWLIAIVLGGFYLFRLPWPPRYKVAALAIVAVLGMGIFAVRFHTYFARGATSAVARLDYWRAAVQTTISHPGFGTGPGTFQRPYAQLKAPDAEMARLAHNDYLEQFSDSGFPAGIFYCLWLAMGMAFIGTTAWKSKSPVEFALFVGLLGWAIQEFGEFGLYIPASAWTAFTLLGSTLALGKARTDASAA